MADTQCCGFGSLRATTAPNLALHWSQTKENTEGVCQLLLTSADAISDPLFSVASPCLSTPSRLSSSPLPSSRGGSQQQVKDHDPPPPCTKTGCPSPQAERALLQPRGKQEVDGWGERGKGGGVSFNELAEVFQND